MDQSKLWSKMEIFDRSLDNGIVYLRTKVLHIQLQVGQMVDVSNLWSNFSICGRKLDKKTKV
jgi:hypothetical protein